ncbi:MAG: hypothetical protein EXS31_07430 [Pedosphaera sp.]|nr:hypothetical protein [Pedosphaera sp.]
MTEPINDLIVALREELQQYGELLVLLNRQQEQVIARASDEVVQSVSDIQSQARVVQQARVQREGRQKSVARRFAVAENAAFVTLIALMPQDYQPLVEALVNENNDLMRRVQKRARQNHLLLSRSLELMQRFMGMLFPTREVQMYNDHGGRHAQLVSSRPIYEAVG